MLQYPVLEMGRSFRRSEKITCARIIAIQVRMISSVYHSRNVISLSSLLSTKRWARRLRHLSLPLRRTQTKRQNLGQQGIKVVMIPPPAQRQELRNLPSKFRERTGFAIHIRKKKQVCHTRDIPTTRLRKKKQPINEYKERQGEQGKGYLAQKKKKGIPY